MRNLGSSELIELAVKTENATLTETGALRVITRKYTGRAPNGKRIVFDRVTKDCVDWNNNVSISLECFRDLLEKFKFYHQNRTIYSQDVYAVRDPKHSLAVRIHTKHAKHSLFVRNMFIPHEEPDGAFKPDWEVFHFPDISDEPQVLICFSKRTILISGTYYSGEIKKSVFTVLNFLFPDSGHLPMHCSVNTDKNRENPAIFFGLSGTGKTTLSSDESRILIGDDEHGWTESGLTNFEGGCYAKTIRLSKKDEPQIWAACHRSGTILENVVLKDGVPDFDDGSITENTRASYPTDFIDGADDAGWVDCHPKNIIMLTCDAFGVLPPVMKLTSDEAVEQFLLGYTAKVAGTESGVTEPKATFSPCFGAPFMPLKPAVYGKLLKEKIEKHDVNCWFVNTGWTGGPYGIGNRIPISVTREIIDRIHNGDLANTETFLHQYTGFMVPMVSQDVIPQEILEPEKGWEDLENYKTKVSQLMADFVSVTNN